MLGSFVLRVEAEMKHQLCLIEITSTRISGGVRSCQKALCGGLRPR